MGNKNLPSNTIKHNEVIVVGGDHYNTLWVARSLGMAGYSPIVVIYGVSKSFVTKSKYIKKSICVLDEESLLDVLNKTLYFDTKPILFSSNDIATDIIDRNYNILRDNYYLPNCSNEEGKITYWMNKSNMLETAKEVGLNVPFTKELKLPLDDSTNIEDIPFPCIIKPQNSSRGSKRTFRICTKKDDFKTTLTEIQDGCTNVIIQEFLKPDFEFNLLGFRHRNSKTVVLPGIYHRLATCNSIHNLGMPAYAYVLNDTNDFVNVELVKKFLEKIDYEGLFSLEFFNHKGTNYFLEMNLRVDGDLYPYTISGCNMPVSFIKLINGNYDLKEEDKYVQKKTYGMVEISYLKYCDYKHPWKIIKDFIKSDCFSIFSLTDIKPFVYKFIYAFKK